MRMDVTELRCRINGIIAAVPAYLVDVLDVQHTGRLHIPRALHGCSHMDWLSDVLPLTLGCAWGFMQA